MSFLLFIKNSIPVALTTLLGAILGWIITLLFSAPEDIQLWYLLLSTVITVTACSFFIVSIKKINSDAKRINENLEKCKEKNATLIDTAIRQQATLVPRDRVYYEMARCIDSAQEKVVVFTYYMYSKEKGSHTFKPAQDGDIGRDEFYESLYRCINNDQVEYTRVWQVPMEIKTECVESILKDKCHKKEYDLINKITGSRPDLARFIVSDHHTTASIIMIDNRNLFINIDYYEPETDTWLSPFMLFIKDSDSTSLSALKSIITKLTSKS